jgi:hypothetical protein
MKMHSVKENKMDATVVTQEAQTQNGMRSLKGSTNACVDLFYKIGASRGRDITAEFTQALLENSDVALRIAQWARDVRGGAGERQLFRDILVNLEQRDPEMALSLMRKVPEIGRWDDLFVFTTPRLKAEAYAMLKAAILEGNGLAAKWCPRKGPVAHELRIHFGMTPKQYRKTLVGLTKVVETQMCANDWDNINFSHVPSQASRIYRKAFQRHTPLFAEYVDKLANKDTSVKVNASAIFPHDVIKGVAHGYMNKTELGHIQAQWDALPNYVGMASILPLVDVSASMTCSAGKTSVRCIDVAVGLGLYLADKNQGAFKDKFLTFSTEPQLLELKGSVVEKLNQMVESKWQMSTNLHRAIDCVLTNALLNNVPEADMPKMLLVLSDMQFDQCVRYDDSAMEMIERRYAQAGYTVPHIVFWNLSSHDNVPVTAHKSGAALVSGFSPSIMSALLSADVSQFTPEGIMLETLMVPRYDI